ncbi:MAG: WecB/TagA/CpsF family glycosyltransferase [Rhodospirillales bacterium]|nr:WecB/TagA/CpsF family glycosyltransferase [Rhodospirillales bacterium]
MPIIALLRLIGAQATRQERVTWVDFIWPLLQRAQIRGWRVFWVGNTPEAMRNGLAVVRSRYPTLTIDGVDGYFDTTAGSEDNRGVIERMNDFGTDVCIVGMGTPRQESWVKENRSLIDAPVVLTAGACLEYVSGAVATPPRWMGRWGLEWSYRLFENPGRFARRYLVEPWALLGMLLLQSLGLRRSGCENSLPREIGSES